MISVVATEEDQALVDLYREHYRSLVRMAALLLDDVALAEEVVQDGFVQLHRSWSRVSEPSKRPAYLRSIVLNAARSSARRRGLGRRLEIVRSTNDVSAEASAVQHEDRREVLAALRALPDRQRECLVLRYYLDLSEAAIADTLGISAGSVKTHTHRGLAALERALESTR
jgi:RNA polymerase sigma-70 factor (sigma-E family)